MLHAGQALGRIVIFVVDVDIVAHHGTFGLGLEQKVVDERLGGFARKLHHHSGRRVGVHVGVFASYVVRFGLDDFEKNVSGLGLSSHIALIPISYVALGHFLARALHQFHLDAVLNLLHRHLALARYFDSVCDLTYQTVILALLGLKHSSPDCRSNFFFVKTDNAAIAF